MRLLGVHVIGEHATELLNWCISVCLPCLWREGAKCLPVLVLTFQLSAIFIESRLARLWRLGSRPGERNLPTNPARKLGIPVDEAGRRWSAEVPKKVAVWGGALEPRPRTDLHRRKMAHRPARRAGGLLNLASIGNRIESRWKVHIYSRAIRHPELVDEVSDCT